MAFLSYSKILGADDVAITDGMLCPIPGRCRKCGAFRVGGCAVAPGMSQCRFGYSVYYDERARYMFFGARVEGFHDPSKVTCTKVPIYLNQRQFATFVRYDSRKYDQSQIESMVDAFSSQYDRIIRQIKDALPRYDQEAIVYLEPASVEKVCNAVNSLDDLKRSTEAFVFQQTPFSLFPSASGVEESVFKPEAICGTCRSRVCGNAVTSEEFSCNMCENGCSYCSFRHRHFFGLRIVGFYRKSLCQSPISRKRISRFEPAQIRGLVEEQVRQNEMIYSIRRFLHDIGQYLFGMGNLLPSRNGTNGVVSCAASDIRSIAAFVSALRSLKREYFRYRNPVMATVRRNFEPFPLFYKYRLCFECKDVRIEVKDLDQEPGTHEHESIEGPVGFEFVTLNLISNAVKYLPRTEFRYRTIKILLKKDVKGLMIEVASWGPKVDKSEIAFLGERGFRSKDARKADSSGQGLGLSRIIAYARDAGFSIEFHSDDGAITCGGVQYSLFRVNMLIPTIFCRGRRADELIDVSSCASFD